ncbi:DNA polymerase III subunit gamma and tau [Microbacterium sp. ET2]|uniref:DNA polymerase III subunit gamma and tau n=1 Tax=Microbacterium albipurpureum TaxID=3050384 RepID=UPI00259CECAC|nr:DNA polymerase III subunit gamma and tau [Microbacterium sp. ET2 (Ac-2212)]WJL96241.1 DNA polymerase III subunit gamma and tau [Microbacterium sp. ET2 (Ac-2212)]
MTTALYRRYRPEAFGEMIGQSQVTEPLMTALRSDRVGHAYLFSGPRGCGKTTSARILARCLNCAEGPTDTPCGTCESCVELGRGGGGSLDVVEIDAASHNGVDDARDLRERAVFAPARDRFKIFILDEAHMVTPQGFNALLKLVEEPPEHVKFIFATTEPEKVIGTIRSRTHHYPFRLVPPAAMLEYVQTLCDSEGVTVETGVLPLVVRAGGGSPRDTLSLLDQLIAGSDGPVVRYERAVALLGYTHGELLNEVVDAFAAADAAAAFAAVDRVVQTGQDPRRFVDDLLERLRDLIIVGAAGQGAAAVLRGTSAEDLAQMMRQADAFGVERLSRTADIVIGALDDMTGATSPRLQLELMIARVLTHTAASTGGGAGASPAAHVVAAPAPPATSSSPVAETVAEASSPAVTSAPTPAAESWRPIEAPTEAPASAAPTPVQPVATPPAGPVTLELMRNAWPEVLARLEDLSRSSWLVATTARVADLRDDVLTLSFQSQADLVKFKQRSAGAGPSEDLRTAIQGVLGIRVKYLARHDAGAGDASHDEGPRDDGGEDGPPPPPDPRDDRGPSDPPGRGGAARQATAGRPPQGAPMRGTPDRSVASGPGGSAAGAVASVTEWAVAPIPRDASEAGGDAGARVMPALAVDDDPEDAAIEVARVRAASAAPRREGQVLPASDVVTSSEPDDDSDTGPTVVDAPVPPVVAPPIISPARSSGGMQRYGEAVVRQVLGARFVREEPHQSPTRFG